MTIQLSRRLDVVNPFAELWRLFRLRAKAVRLMTRTIAREIDPGFYSASIGRRMNTYQCALHYVTTGADLGLPPNREFDTEFYLRHSPDVRAANINPFYHYLTYGRNEGRIAHPGDFREIDEISIDPVRELIRGFFDADYYRRNHPFVADNNIDPIGHYLVFGWKRGFDPTSDFSTARYIKDHPECDWAAINPFVHYLREKNRWKGFLERFDDDLVSKGIRHLKQFPLFNDKEYLELNAPLREVLGLNLPLHAFTYGLPEGREIFKKRTVARQLGLQSRALTLAGDASPARPDLATCERFSVVYNEAGNLFLKDIAECLAADLTDAGHVVTLRTEKSDLEEDCGHNIIVAPHEFFFIGDGRRWGSSAIVRRSFMLNTEQPQTLWFNRGVPYVMMSRGVIDISPQVAALYAASGLPAVHANLSGAPSFDAPPSEDDILLKVLPAAAKAVGNADSATALRAIDVSFFGGITEHRDRFFAKSAAFFSDYKCFFYFRKDAGPITPQADANLLLAARHVGFHSKLVLNIHRDEFGFFEWHRIVRLGMETGAIVVSEPCLPHQVFKPGEHYFEESGRHIQNLVDWLLNSPDGREEARAVRRRAKDTLARLRADHSAGRTIARFVAAEAA